jgi:DNA-binding NarL/FixJ family response regulator
MGLAHTQQAIVQCVEAGVAGYVLKDSPLDDLLRAVRTAAGTEGLAAPAAVMALGEPLALEGCADSEFGEPQSLTRREREVLSLVQQGLTNQEIAESLVIERGTVKNHVHNILRKLNVNSRRDAAHVSRLAGLWGAGDLLFRPVLSAGVRPALRQPEWAGLFGGGLGARQPANAVAVNR